jgi:plastocyanin
MKKNENSRTRLSEAIAALAVVAGSVLLAGPSLAANTNVDLTASNQFDQANVTVSQGDTVTFTWRGGFHDVVFSDGVSSGTPVGIDGTTFSRTFDAAGTYGYICTVHESAGMVGSVIVEAAAAATTTAPAVDTTAPAVDTTATTVASSAESAATTVAPSSGSASNAAPTGGAPAAGGSATTQPFTGPERSLLPAAGVALMLGGVAIRLRLRRTG